MYTYNIDIHVHTYIYICIYIFMNIHTCISILTYMYTHMYAYTYEYVHSDVYKSTSNTDRMQSRIRLCVSDCIYTEQVCVYLIVYIQNVYACLYPICIYTEQETKE